MPKKKRKPFYFSKQSHDPSSVGLRIQKILPQHKKAQRSCHILKGLSYSAQLSMKTSERDLMVSRNIYPDAVTCDRILLIGSKCDQ